MNCNGFACRSTACRTSRSSEVRDEMLPISFSAIGKSCSIFIAPVGAPEFIICGAANSSPSSFHEVGLCGSGSQARGTAVPCEPVGLFVEPSCRSCSAVCCPFSWRPLNRGLGTWSSRFFLPSSNLRGSPITWKHRLQKPSPLSVSGRFVPAVMRQSPIWRMHLEALESG